jgi:hypothetical protein
MIMAVDGHKRSSDELRELRKKNLRTALLVGGLALFFFVMLFVKRLWLN